ncbi:MAG: amidohydrolase [Bacteroidales bacterium]|jgi:predicted amidohydrolase|nr:amidohydrolase [Bacteroidales bacterium]
MKISVIQPDTIWEDKVHNLEKIEQMMSELKDTDVVILPEMFNTGFSMNPEHLYESPGSVTFDWMIHISEKKNFGICGSYIVRDNNRYFNRWIFVTPENKFLKYDKRHLFRMSNEEESFTPGKKRLTFRFRDIRICANICYDLRFPVWSRNKNDYDLLINSANWPLSRKDVWITLLKARAIENQCFVAAANRVGTDGAGIKYCGNSMIIDPKGVIIASANQSEECSISGEISMSELSAFRTKFPVWKDADNFTIKS